MMYCDECDRIEGDPIGLDAERCLICGGMLPPCDDDDTDEGDAAE